MLNLWDAAKAMLRGNFIALYSYIIKEERSQLNILNIYCKKLNKERQNKLNTSRRKERDKKTS